MVAVEKARVVKRPEVYGVGKLKDPELLRERGGLLLRRGGKLRSDWLFMK
jgi:hypothetical protein